jgi:GNAT superfamily N-acetyltransferase
MAGGILIRELREADAAAVSRLELAIVPHYVITPEVVWQRASRTIAREQARTWVAEDDGEVVAYAHASFEWSVPTPGKGRFWIGVLPDRRGRGIGSELYSHVSEYLLSRGAWRLRSWVDDDPAGARFLERRGFQQHDTDRVSRLDLGEMDPVEPHVPEGFRLVPLGEARDRERDLYEICATGEIDMPGDEPETELSFEDWLQDDYGSPALSEEGSFVALAGDQPVSLAFLIVDPERRLAYNEMTATLPEYRRNGLALAVKSAAARWAAANGFERIVTENAADNVGMLAINRKLGYRHLHDQVGYLLVKSGKARPASAGSTCAVTQTGVVT